MHRIASAMGEKGFLGLMGVRKDKCAKLQNAIRISDSSTVFQAEVFAIQAAANFLRDRNFNFAVDFFVDSQSALQALCSDFISSKVVFDTVSSLNELGHGVLLFWVRAHNGNTFNELVDELAKHGTETADVSTVVPVSRKVIREEVLSKLRELWDAEWVEYDEARMSKMFFQGQDKHKAKQICALTRFQLGRLIRATTGHNQLRYFQHVVDPAIYPFCRYCGVEFETFYHWVSDCSAFEADRHSCFLGQSPLFSQWKIEEILNFAFSFRQSRAFSGHNLPEHLDPNDDTQSQRSLAAHESDVDDPDDPGVPDSHIDSDSDSYITDISMLSL